MESISLVISLGCIDIPSMCNQAFDPFISLPIINTRNSNIMERVYSRGMYFKIKFIFIRDIISSVM